MAYWLDPNADNKGNCKSYICDYVSDIALLPRFNVKGADTDSIDVASQQPCSYGSTCVCIENGSAYMLTKDTNEWRAMSVSDSGGGSSSQDVSELRNRIENIETALDGHTIGTDVPEDAKFTDTVYDDTAVKADILANTEAINQNKTDISLLKETTINGVSVSRELDSQTDLKIAGKIVTGQSFNINGQNVVAQDGAEAFNGMDAIATGKYSHAEGAGTTASGDYSHAEGVGTIASSNYQHVQGKYNVEDANNKYAFIIGNGGDANNRSNALAIDWDGKIYINNSETGIDLNDLLNRIIALENK